VSGSEGKRDRTEEGAVVHQRAAPDEAEDVPVVAATETSQDPKEAPVYAAY
jgi:hypothetical protein